MGMSDLLQFDQRPVEILRVKEQHRFAVGADFRFAITEDTGALLF